MKTYKFIQSSVDLFPKGILKNDEIIPCTEEEVHLVEAHSGRTLPAAYKEFLLWGGRKIGHFMCGELFFYPSIHQEKVKEVAKSLLQQNEITTVEIDRLFIYQMHGYYEFDFFYLGEGDDPKVYFYSVSYPKKVTLVNEKFSQRIYKELNQYVKRKEHYFLEYAYHINELSFNPIYTKSFSVNGSVKFARLPEKLYEFKNLERLDLRFSAIEELDERMEVFQQLQELNLNGNKLKHLPKEVLELVHLKTIYISGNEFSAELLSTYTEKYSHIKFYT